jgi:signal transduction histidine kinase
LSDSTASAPTRESFRQRTIDLLPRGNTLSDAEWARRHRLLLVVLGLQVPLLIAVGTATGWPLAWIGGFVGWTVLLTAAAATTRRRRIGSFLVTLGLTSCSIALVVLSNGSIEAHFHFFVIVGFLALYQDWFPFLWNIAFTILSHGIGSAFVPDLIFNHVSGQGDPWLWSLIHGLSVLAACTGVLLFWRYTEDLQDQKSELAAQLAQSEISKKEFTSDLLLNLARRNQSMYHRQLDIINDLEEKERDPDVLAELFRLDHLATRVRRNAESLLVLSGEQAPRVWSAPVALRDVVRAAIAETEDLDRITFTVDEGLAIVGNSVADLTHLLAELLENAVRYSPPTSTVTVTNRPYHPSPGSHLLVVEDTGVGMPTDDLARANELLTAPQEVDVSASRRLGFHVVSRLAERHGITATLTPTPGCGLTAVLVLPAALFPSTTGAPRRSGAPALRPAPTPEGATGRSAAPPAAVTSSAGGDGRHAWPGAARPGSGSDHHTPPSTAPGEVVATANPNGRPGAHDLGRAPASARGGLIHPIVVPPPREIGGDGAALGAGADLGRAREGEVGTPAPRSSPEAPTAGTSDGAEASGGDAGPPRRTLSRRVPQSHLAPELAQPSASPDDPPTTRPAAAPHSGSAAPHHADGTDGSAGTPVDPPADTSAGALTALSRYQASRRMAHLEINEGRGAEDRRGSPDRNGASS